MNKERLLKIIEDMQECKADIDECIDIKSQAMKNCLNILVKVRIKLI